MGEGARREKWEGGSREKGEEGRRKKGVEGYVNEEGGEVEANVNEQRATGVAMHGRSRGRISDDNER